MGIAEVVGDGRGAGHHLLGRVAADQWSRQPLTGARDADGRDHFAVVVAHWRGDAAHVDLALLLVGGIATAADRVQLREQRIDVGDSRGREAWQAGDAVVPRPPRAGGRPAAPCRGRCSEQAGPRRRGTSCTRPVVPTGPVRGREHASSQARPLGRPRRSRRAGRPGGAGPACARRGPTWRLRRV